MNGCGIGMTDGISGYSACIIQFSSVQCLPEAVFKKSITLMRYCVSEFRFRYICHSVILLFFQSGEKWKHSCTASLWERAIKCLLKRKNRLFGACFHIFRAPASTTHFNGFLVNFNCGFWRLLMEFRVKDIVWLCVCVVSPFVHAARALSWKSCLASAPSSILML